MGSSLITRGIPAQSRRMTAPPRRAPSTTAFEKSHAEDGTVNSSFEGQEPGCTSSCAPRGARSGLHSTAPLSSSISVALRGSRWRLLAGCHALCRLCHGSRGLHQQLKLPSCASSGREHRVAQVDVVLGIVWHQTPPEGLIKEQRATGAGSITQNIITTQIVQDAVRKNSSRSKTRFRIRSQRRRKNKSTTASIAGKPQSRSHQCRRIVLGA
ncbi:unnamed protein product [Prorocentrum cordatum]|uniref:Uncharacterized protein n=1 Tax=Prorocentrum cordatum TaxID=2364126 RepID=A0ABN9VDA8_9DINO|nr:unnamed protein product [Polarella glacialis]